jgi:hypothetical protein
MIPIFGFYTLKELNICENLNILKKRTVGGQEKSQANC